VTLGFVAIRVLHGVLKGVPKGQQPEKTLFEIRNRLARELYEVESAAVKQEVEEHRQSMRGSKEVSNIAEKNMHYQQ
jgi:hypothetical protein